MGATPVPATIVRGSLAVRSRATIRTGGARSSPGDGPSFYFSLFGALTFRRRFRGVNKLTVGLRHDGRSPRADVEKTGTFPDRHPLARPLLCRSGFLGFEEIFHPRSAGTGLTRGEYDASAVWTPRPWQRSVLAVLGMAGCAQPRAPINQVQPDYISKADLIPVEYAALTQTGVDPSQLTPQMLAQEPVFYTQSTLIQKPTHGGFVGLTSYNQSDKIRWEVTENYLMARQAWEYIHNAPQGTGGIGGTEQIGDIVAVFAIQSHFDIRRSYNTTTGEELNVIVENSTDRPWYQRQYMHVDWSQNLITGYNSIFDEQLWQGQYQSEPVANYINNPQDPNAPVFQRDSNGNLLYFDFVNRAVLHPETTSISFTDAHAPTTFSQFPACYLDGNSPEDCTPAEVSFRVAFRRVDPNRDYEPASLTVPLTGENTPVPSLDMERFGFFDMLRVGYDRDQHAILDTQRVHFAARHNLWLHHHLQPLGANTATTCNADADCTAEGTVCHIGNTAASATNRGFCAPLAIAHLPTTAAPTSPGGIAGQDIACQADADCQQTFNGVDNYTGISRTAVCDQSSHTCGEHYYRCSMDTDCQQYDPQSTCDLAISYNRNDNYGLCLMPFRQRQVRQIAYYESPNYPDYMQPVTNQIVHEWNDAFHTAVVAEARRRSASSTRRITSTRRSCRRTRNRSATIRRSRAWHPGSARMHSSCTSAATAPCGEPTRRRLAMHRQPTSPPRSKTGGTCRSAVADKGRSRGSATSDTT